MAIEKEKVFFKWTNKFYLFLAKSKRNEINLKQKLRQKSRLFLKDFFLEFQFYKKWIFLFLFSFFIIKNNIYRKFVTIRKQWKLSSSKFKMAPYYKENMVLEKF